MEVLNRLATERRDNETKYIDRQTTENILYSINKHDETVAAKVKEEIPKISMVVDAIVGAFQKGGRLLYVGAGTSGRLGILDASECPPTFGTGPDMVQGLIAGGPPAILTAVEGAEDNEELGRKDIAAKEVDSRDIIVGIAASGRTPYVIGALKEAGERGAKTVSFSCNRNAAMNEYSDHQINVEVGPEVIMGSTRMKAGTAQKLVLNMLTTASMIKMGKVYENLMVDVQPTNQKLVDRAKRIIQLASGCTPDEAKELFDRAGGNLKAAIIMHKTKCSKPTAESLLREANGFVYHALEGI
ncbi:N-acetylmuramic acid 6-phosphate etherase [Falsibacillus albus]|uniref:N-acetylmuramic acid 6-phosphate etherase n=1 Tax=Falsibacillus albus TaxID=2478915 RepID=A0A3L7JVN0_9BACI|nr:N-acetylmuramic acid 6-phosphate etherase [Falsibacillus albus]RLQ94783.1 N-acetylmuramic acid 6-phosphate etherase [Falsibacillus albus]